VPREDVAAESSISTWATVLIDLLTGLDYYKGRAYTIEDAPGDDTCFYAFVGNVFGFKALRHTSIP